MKFRAATTSENDASAPTGSGERRTSGRVTHPALPQDDSSLHGDQPTAAAARGAGRGYGDVVLGGPRTVAMAAVVAAAHAAVSVSVSEAGVVSAALLLIVGLAVGRWARPLASLRVAAADADAAGGGVPHPHRVRRGDKVESTHPGLYSLFVIRR